MSKSLKIPLIKDFEISEGNNNPDNEYNYAQNLFKGKLYLLYANIILSISCLLIKYINIYRNDYSYNVFSFLRFGVMFLLSYSLMLYKDEKITSLINFQNKKWIIIRISCNYIAIYSFTYSLFYIRLSTTTCIYMVYPIFTNLLSILFFKEEFKLKYFFGCILCFLGCCCFLFSESNDTTENKNLINLSILLGIFLSLLDGFSSSLISISSKFLMKENSSNQINLIVGFYIGLYSLIQGLIFSPQNFFSDLLDFRIFVCSMLGGFCIFWGFHFINLSANITDLSKVSYIHYSQVVFNILFGMILFKEVFGLFDLIGLVLIVGTNIYLTFWK